MNRSLLRRVNQLFPKSCQQAAKARRPIVLPSQTKRLAKEEVITTTIDQPWPDLTKYRLDPCGFAKDILDVKLWDRQKEMLESLIAKPRRTLSRWGHSVGKTFGEAVTVCWWYYTRRPSVTATTAPTQKAVRDLLWAEIRMLVRRAKLPNHFIGPAATEMRDPDFPEDHWAMGFTAQNGESFQGRHRESMAFLFDEAEALDKVYWTVTNTMFKPDDDHIWLACCNPTTTSSQRYQEEKYLNVSGGKKWFLHAGSSLEHPNIAVGLRNREREARGEQPEPLPYPNAVSLDQAEEWIGEWCEQVQLAEVDPLIDFQHPPGSGQWWRPGPEGESRILGRNPSAGTYGVWSESLWKLAIASGIGPNGEKTPRLMGSLAELPEIGCDVARFGDDRTELHGRHGPCSLFHEDHGGWDTVRTADRCMELADDLAKWYCSMRPAQAQPITGQQIPIKVDDTGVGGGVTDILSANGYNVVPVNAGSCAQDDSKYPLIRDELWFVTRDMAKAGELDLSRLPPKVLNRLEIQALAPTWKPTQDRRRKVETKEETKKRLGRSPDGLDAVNLAYYRASAGPGAAEWIGGSRDGGPSAHSRNANRFGRR